MFCFSTGAVVGFETRDLRILAEGQSIFLIVDGRGFSYGSIPVEVTPLPCSDYPGDLSTMFNDIPAASITLGAPHTSYVLYRFRLL